MNQRDLTTAGEVAPGIHRIESVAAGRINSTLLFVGSDGVLLGDTGIDSTPSTAILPYLQAVGMQPRDIRYVINTHSDMDHTGGNATLSEASPQSVFMCHELDRAMVDDLSLMIRDRYDEFVATDGLVLDDDSHSFFSANARHRPVHLGLRGGERIHLGSGRMLDVLHTPGHSRGHVSIHDRGSRTLFIGDAVLGDALVYTDGRPAFPPTYRYVDDYLATIQIVTDLAPETLLCSHFPIMREGDVAAFCRSSLEFVDRTDDAVRSVLRLGGPLGLVELATQLSPRLGGWDQTPLAVWALASPLAGHLERLVADGEVTVSIGDGRRLFEWQS